VRDAQQEPQHAVRAVQGAVGGRPLGDARVLLRAGVQRVVACWMREAGTSK
jgi:hypothetical protein